VALAGAGQAPQDGQMPEGPFSPWAIGKLVLSLFSSQLWHTYDIRISQMKSNICERMGFGAVFRQGRNRHKPVFMKAG
jgi:hypothetical protein